MELIKKKISLRSIEFGELSAKVSWLRKFFMESRAYMYCKRFDSSYWRYEGPAGVVSGCSVEIITPDAIVSATYPSEPSYGDVVVISDDADMFNNAYGTLSNAKQAFEDGCAELENGGGKPTHFHINVLLTEKYEDLGRFVDAGESVDVPIPEIPHDAFVAFTDSKLETLKRRTKSYDIDGNELPFTLNAENECELPYVIGLPFNVRTASENGWLYDVVNEISFENEDGEIGLSKTSGTVTADGVDEEECPIICIKYELGRIEYSDNTKVHGALYEEKYRYSIKKGIFNVRGGIPEEYEYIDIDYSTTAGLGWENMAAVRIDGADESLGCENFIFDEAMAGIHDYSESVENVYIERGTSASFEPLNLMGQFNSVEEIERYRNDLFKISKENS